MRKYLGQHLPWLLAITFVVLFLTHNLWGTRAWIETHDGIFHLIRQEVFTDALKRGNFPVRWAGTLDNGFGIPLFNYIYPGPYYLGAPLSLIGLSSKWVIKLVEIGLYLLGSLGMYFLFAKKNKFYATVSAILYLTTPYLLLNLFIRGALGEVMAISFMPWILVALNDIDKKKKLSWYHPLPYFFMFIAHNFLSFLFLPIYMIIIYFRYRKVWMTTLKSFVLSLGLAAFFVLPMLAEEQYLFSIVKQNFTYNYADHFIYPIQLIYGKWGNGHSYTGLNDGFSFALGITNLVVLVAGVITAVKKKSQDLNLWLIITGLVLLFLLPVAAPLWKIFSPLQMIQFPWRLLSFTPVVIPIVAFYLLSNLKKSKNLNYIISIFLLISLYFGFRYSTPFYFQNNEQLAQQLYIHRNQTTTSSRLEMLPKWGSVEERWMGNEHVRVEKGSAEFSNIITAPEKLVFTADSSDSNTTYHVRRNYYPSWFIKDESNKSYIAQSTSDGEIEFTGQIGTHTYTVYVGSTRIEQLANLISLVSILTCLYIFFSKEKSIRNRNKK